MSNSRAAHHFSFPRVMSVVAGTVAIAALLTPVAVWVAYELAFRGRIYPGIVLADTLTRVQQTTLVVSHQPVDQADPVREWELPLAQLDFQLNAAATQQALINAGRSGNLLSDLRTKAVAYRRGVTVEPSLIYDQELLLDFVASVSGSIDTPVIEPKFRLADGKVTEFQPGSPGRQVDRQLLGNRIITSALAATSDSPASAVEIPVVTLVPQKPVGEVTAESLGIRERLGRGSSLYRGSIAGRKHNVALTASRIDGILIPPGATFSFNETVGEVSRQTGFQSAYVIRDGRTVLGDGGGVCQVSTTLFRAVLNSGLPVVERKAHSYRVGYYEQDSPPGLDATVYAPSPDFRFTNDTPAYVLIQAAADTAGSSLTIDLWGTSDGRVATVTKPVIVSQTPAPPNLYQDDPSLPVGVIKQIDWSAPGAKVAFKYTVRRGGEILHEKSFLSLYRPWQAVFLRGTGG